MLREGESHPLAFREYGTIDPPIVLLHGFTGSVAAWGEGLLEDLSRDRRLIALDLPGHGRTARAPDHPDRVPPWGALPARIAATLDSSGAAAVDLVGYSMGGRIALAFALSHPERVRRLVLESASPGLEDDGERVRRRFDDEKLAREIEELGIEVFVERWMAMPLFHSQRSLPPEVRNRERARRLGNDPAALAAALRELGAGAQPSLWGRLHELSAPTLLLTGAQDPRFGSIAERMEERIPGAVRRSVPEVGHAVHLEAPARWLSEVQGFLA